MRREDGEQAHGEEGDEESHGETGLKMKGANQKDQNETEMKQGARGDREQMKKV